MENNRYGSPQYPSHHAGDGQENWEPQPQPQPHPQYQPPQVQSYANAGAQPHHSAAHSAGTIPSDGAQPYAHAQNTVPPVTPTMPTPEPPRKQGGTLKTFFVSFSGAALACVLAFALAFGTGIVRLPGATSGTSTILGSNSTSSISAVSSEENSTLSEQVAAKVLPSIVSINVYANQNSSMGNRGWMYGDNNSANELTQTSLGSGVIVSADGYIITNNHVVDGAQKLDVILSDGGNYNANVVGTDPSSDLAVLKIDATGLTAIEIGSSSDLKVGEWVMSAGSPFGLEQSVATGIISATSRTITVQNSSSGASSGQTSVYSGMIQTDAAINPGNSGGALVDSNGRLIGINSVIESASGGYSGVGFAIPVDYAIDIAQQIIKGETPSHASLGVSVVSLNSSIANRYGLSTNTGAYVNGVYAGSAAEKAGLQEGDIIIKVDNTTISSSTDLIAAIRTAGTGANVKITYLRDGKEQTANATLGSDKDLASASIIGKS